MLCKFRKRSVDFAQKRALNKKFTLTPELSYIYLTEEMGEIANSFLIKKILSELFDKENLKEEMIDVILEAIILANFCDGDLEKEIDKKINFLFKKEVHKTN